MKWDSYEIRDEKAMKRIVVTFFGVDLRTTYD